MMWVIDTSALIRLFVPDGPIHPEVETALNHATSGDAVVFAPHLILVEAANVLLRKRRRGELTVQELGELLLAVKSLPIRLCEHETLLLPACGLAETYNLSAYDALYLALAEQHGARLLTNDDALDKVARKIGLA
ncbi:MAG: hypothetical protein A3F73_01155 [Gallionellales bacterium RIFCSPLOWO2_12_FULL_59_22]|nr:MAG: hypothetical protein A3H99_10080 [Gallionellales bacterium RIFCSPLOWO2_02_FULL_59_110]OGT04600.1 MAG: hypothetical protein A2Z65_03845 [Gallionellales bacterium RIFCSPLOWO2_02_58_13]OGT12920.1 MAG: hypothetical protein A3F73_01155 [Gallionellales bacterium RIFCSPLOWO2_12_FULL_59_22]